MEVCGSGSLDAATNLIGVTNQSLSCPSFCYGGQGRVQAVLKQCLAAAAAARKRCHTISSRWTLGCLPPRGQSDKKIRGVHIPPSHDPSK